MPLPSNVSNCHIIFLMCVFLPFSQWPWPREIGLWGVRLVHVWVPTGLGALISQDDCCWQKLWVLTYFNLFIFRTCMCMVGKKVFPYCIIFSYLQLKCCVILLNIMRRQVLRGDKYSFRSCSHTTSFYPFLPPHLNNIICSFTTGIIQRPACQQVYNLFHPTDPLAIRVEPLISARFSVIPPVTIPRYAKYPLGDGMPTSLCESLCF